MWPLVQTLQHSKLRSSLRLAGTTVSSAKHRFTTISKEYHINYIDLVWLATPAYRNTAKIWIYFIYLETNTYVYIYAYIYIDIHIYIHAHTIRRREKKYLESMARKEKMLAQSTLNLTRRENRTMVHALIYLRFGRSLADVKKVKYFL